MPLNLLFICIWIWQADIQRKPSDEYKIELEYKFKQRDGANPNIVEFEDDQRVKEKKKYAAGSLPYLVINFVVLKLSSEEVRIKAYKGDDEPMLSKKTTVGDSYKLDLGFTDDMKDRVTPHEFNIFFLNDKKKEVSVVNLSIAEDGTFLVNGEKRGRF